MINLGNRMGMTWMLTWLNASVATLDVTIQILVIYRYRLHLDDKTPIYGKFSINYISKRTKFGYKISCSLRL